VSEAQAREPGEQGSKWAPPTKLLGEQLVHPAPPIFSVTYSSNSPASGALLQTPLYIVYTFFDKYILHKVILWIWLSWLFFTNFCFPNRKVVQLLLPPTEISFPRLWSAVLFLTNSSVKRPVCRRRNDIGYLRSVSLGETLVGIMRVWEHDVIYSNNHKVAKLAKLSRVLAGDSFRK